MVAKAEFAFDGASPEAEVHEILEETALVRWSNSGQVGNEEFMARWPDAGFLTTSDQLHNSTGSDDGGLEDHTAIHSAFNIGYMFFRPSALPLVGVWRDSVRADPRGRWDQGEFNKFARLGKTAARGSSRKVIAAVSTSCGNIYSPYPAAPVVLFIVFFGGRAFSSCSCGCRGRERTDGGGWRGSWEWD